MTRDPVESADVSVAGNRRPTTSAEMTPDERRERQGRVVVEATGHPDDRRAVIARCVRCRADLSGANDVLTLAFLLDVGSDHACE